MFFIDFDPFLFFLIGFDCFEHDRGRCGWDRVWRALIRTNSYLLRFCQHERGQNLARSEVSNKQAHEPRPIPLSGNLRSVPLVPHLLSLKKDQPRTYCSFCLSRERDVRILLVEDDVSDVPLGQTAA